MKILLHGVCSFPYFFKELPILAPEIDWHITIHSWRHLAVCHESFSFDQIHYVHNDLNKLMGYHHFPKYPGNIFRAIAADKGEDGQLRTKGREYQIKNCLAYHALYRDILMGIKPNCVIIPIVETHESVILFDTCKELKIPCYVVTGTRLWNLSYFSPGLNEELPNYVLKDK